MTSDNFCYWLQGWFELNSTIKNDNKETTEATLRMIADHLQLVFKKETMGYELLHTQFTGVSSDLLC